MLVLHHYIKLVHLKFFDFTAKEYLISFYFLGIRICAIEMTYTIVGVKLVGMYVHNLPDVILYPNNESLCRRRNRLRSDTNFTLSVRVSFSANCYGLLSSLQPTV